jgi:hypothetical protein
MGRCFCTVNFKWLGKKWSCLASGYSTNIFLDKLRKNTKPRGVLAEGGALNHPEYKIGEPVRVFCVLVRENRFYLLFSLRRTSISKFNYTRRVSKIRGGRYESNASFFLRKGNVIVITMKFTWIIHISFKMMRLFFHEVSVNLNTLLPTLSKTLHIMETLFQFVVICKMAPRECVPYRAKLVAVGGCQVWAVSRTGKNSPSHFCKLVWGRALSWRRRTSSVFRLGRTLQMRCCSLFKVSLYRLWCDPGPTQGILQRCYTASHLMLAKLCWRWWQLCGKTAT